MQASVTQPEASAGRKAQAGQSDTTSSSSMLLDMEDFDNLKQIGKGKDCVVYAAKCQKLGGGTVVLKVYDKATISAVKHRSIRREARIMRYLTESKVPYITSYIGAFQNSAHIYIVMEHCGGGDLLEQLLREGRAMTERRVVREVVLPILTSLTYLHAAGIIHRDIKLENLFVSSANQLQLGDFGLALCTHEENAISPVGTLEYMPPEILKLPSTDLVLKGIVKAEEIVPVDYKVDLWSFGVTVYELVTGRSPFEGPSKDEIRQSILKHNMRPLPSFLTSDCRDFVNKCMTPDYKVRPTAMQLLNHPWTLKHATPADISRIAVLPSMLPKVGMSVSVPPPQAATAATAAAGSAAKAALMSATAAPAGHTAPAVAAPAVPAAAPHTIPVTADSRAATSAAAAAAAEEPRVAEATPPIPAAVTTAPKIQVIADKAGQVPLGSPISPAAGGSILAYVPAPTLAYVPAPTMTDGSNAALSTGNTTGSTVSGISTLSSTCTSYSIQSSSTQSVGSKSGGIAMDKNLPASISTGSSVSVADSAASLQAAPAGGGGITKHPSGSRSPIIPMQEPIKEAAEASEESSGSLGATYPAPRRRSSQGGKSKRKSSKKLLKWMCIAGKGGVRSAQSVSEQQGGFV